MDTVMERVGRQRGARHRPPFREMGCHSSGARTCGLSCSVHWPSEGSLRTRGHCLLSCNVWETTMSPRRVGWRQLRGPQHWHPGRFPVAQSCPTLSDPMDCSTPGLPVHHQLPESTQTRVHRVGDAIQPSHPLSSPSPALNFSQHQLISQLFASGDQRIGTQDTLILILYSTHYDGCALNTANPMSS